MNVAPLLDMVNDLAGFLKADREEKAVKEIRRHERTGHPTFTSPYLFAPANPPECGKGGIIIVPPWVKGD